MVLVRFYDGVSMVIVFGFSVFLSGFSRGFMCVFSMGLVWFCVFALILVLALFECLVVVWF